MISYPERAVISWNAVEVAERVAHDTNGPEPRIDTAAAWLIKHEDALSEAMQYAGMEYIRKNWKEEL